MNTPVKRKKESNKDSGKVTPDLTSSLVVLLVSTAIVIFIFWIASQFLQVPSFQKLPDFISGTYKGFWSTAVTGGAGIGLAIVRAFTHRNEPHPDYLNLILKVTAVLLAAVILIIFLPAMAPKPGPVQQPAPTPGSSGGGLPLPAPTDLKPREIIHYHGVEEIGLDDLPCGEAWMYIGQYNGNPIFRWDQKFFRYVDTNMVALAVPSAGNVITTTNETTLYVDKFQVNGNDHKCDNVRIIPFNSVPPQSHESYAGHIGPNIAVRVVETQAEPFPNAKPSYIWVRITADTKSE